jgi:RluA family pseudouridine synthase
MKPLDIIFENEDFIALNKAAGILSIPDRTQSSESLKDILLKKYGEIFTVHRLDRDTSGVIIFAKSESTHRFLSRAFEERIVEKYYLGLVHGSLINPSGTVDTPIAEHPGKNGKMVVYKKGKPSLTDYKVREDFGTYSLLEFQIHTGRTHQIRVHMQHIGHAIVCDELYGNGEPVFISSLKRNFKLSKNEEEERPMLTRLALHSERLSFTDEKGIHHELEAPLPKDLRALLQQLRKWK